MAADLTLTAAGPPAPLPRPAAGPAAPRVVFFGPARSGKSTLWQLVLRAAGDPGPAPAHGDLTPRVVAAGDPPQAFRLLDSDGREAGELLRGPLHRGRLAAEIAAADALVVTVDAKDGPAEDENLFAALAEFLDRLQTDRTAGRAVGGLPVFLTLTKCDVLAAAGDAPADWLRRVDGRTAELEAHFAAHFGAALDPDDGFLRFGSLTAAAHATAARVPAGPGFGAYADAAGAFGVAGLVAAVFAAAGGHRDRAAAARRRLKYTVAGAAGLLAAMALVGLLLALTGTGSDADRLADRVRQYRAGEPPPAVRLADRKIGRHAREIQAVQADPAFAELPDDLREYVAGRAAEVAAYRRYRAQFDPPRLGPAEAHTADQVRGLAADLAGPLLPPAAYATAWADTEAVRLRAKWAADAQSVTAAAAVLDEFFRDLVRRANALLLTDGPPDFAWRTRVQALLTGATPAFDPAAPIPGSAAVPVLRGKPVTYDAAFRRDRPAAARRDFLDARARLTGLRDIADAVGLATGPGTPGPVLDLPEPAPGGVGSAELAAARLAALAVGYPAKSPAPPRAAAHFPDWVAKSYPDPVRRAVEARLNAIRGTADRHVKRLVRARLGDGPETAEAWRGVAADLLAAPALAAWDELLTLLDDLADHRPADAPRLPGPVAELRAAVGRGELGLDWPDVRVTLPDDLFDHRAAPAGPLTVTVTPAGGGPARDWAFAPAGDGVRDRPVATFPFRPAAGAGKMAYRPGDRVTARLPVKAGPAAYTLVWAAGRSAVFGLDALEQPPRVETPAGGVVTPTAAGVTLAVSPATAWPKTPRLVPDFRAR